MERSLRQAATAGQPLFWVFTVDTDEDPLPQDRETQLSWRGVNEGIPRLREVVDGITEVRLITTWFVRVDDRVEAVEGDRTFLLDLLAGDWRESVGRGDEIGLHPHLYRREGRGWVRETESEPIASQLAASVAAMSERGFRPVSSRIGEGFHSNGTMKALEDLDIQVDSTALPGRTRRDATRVMDWEVTPPFPYHPSKADYRRPGADGLRLLEVPLSMIPTKAEYDRKPLSRYVDLTFHPYILRRGIEQLLAEIPLLVTILHPSGMLRDVWNGRHGLISFEPRAVGDNIRAILAEARRAGRPIQPIALRDCHRLLDNQQVEETRAGS